MKHAATAAATPLVSVVVPVYNGGRHLRASLDSLVAQRHPRVELIVMDDGSTDDSAAIAESYGDALRLVRQPGNLGQFDNVNAGIALARGDYVAVFHADDVYDPDIVEREVAFLEENPGVAAVFCLDRFIDAEGREYARLSLPADVPTDRPLDWAATLEAILRHKNRFLRTPGAMVRADVYREVGGFDARFGSAGDLEMWLRIARSHPIAILPRHLFSYRHFHGSVAQSYQRLRTEPENYFEIVDAHLDAGGRDVVSAAALADHEAHRAEDRLMCAVNRYVEGDVAAARAMLATVHASALVRSRRVQRGRLLVLLGLMRTAARLPRSARLADAFRRRWHGSTAAGSA